MRDPTYETMRMRLAASHMKPGTASASVTGFTGENARIHL
jgi:hypothetical protein